MHSVQKLGWLESKLNFQFSQKKKNTKGKNCGIRREAGILKIRQLRIAVVRWSEIRILP